MQRPIYIIHFMRPADLHVVKRLQDICAIECLRTDSRALSTQVGIALGDLRGCLNTLQVALIRRFSGNSYSLTVVSPVYEGTKSTRHRAASSRRHCRNERSRHKLFQHPDRFILSYL
ncbi:hypothetical protein BC827DRAFT_703865 [Russula dissimulans]|nr:hypothetical protein BC827DRAFT_703865 [Russula dissimulans]